MKKFLFAAIFIAAVVSCAEQDLSVVAESEGTPFTIEVNTAADTRVVVNDDFTVQWVDGDELILVDTESTATSTFTMSEYSGTSATFTGDIPEGVTSFRFIHIPQTFAQKDNSTTLSAGQYEIYMMDQTEGFKSALLVSEIMDSSATSVAMKNITAAVTLNIDFTDSQNTELSMNRILIGNTSRRAYLDLTKSVTDPDFITLGSIKTFKINLNEDEYVGADAESATIKFNIFPTTFTSMPLSLDYDADDDVTHTVNISGEFERGYYYDVNTTVSLSDLPASVYEDVLEVGGYYQGGVVYAINDNVVEIVSIEDVATCTWSGLATPDAFVTADATGTSGAALTAAVVAYAAANNQDLSENYPAVYNCTSYGDDWYLPSKTEMTTFFGVYNSGDMFTSLSVIGVEDIQNNVNYWVADENDSDEEKAKYIKINSGTISSGSGNKNSSSSTRPIRCMKTITIE